MSKFSQFERKVAYALDRFPFLKKIIKNCYIYLTRILRFKGKKSQLNFPTIAVHSEAESFFGYYDKLPSNGKGLVIFHSSPFDTSKQANKAPYVNIILKNELSNKILWKHKTKAFNWQQGSRLQWINDKKFMFNVYDKSTNKYHAKVVSTTDYSIVDYSLPVQDSFDESYFLSLNYKRLATLKPEYGYHCHKPLSYDLLPKYKNDGIWKIDFDSGKSSLILSLSDVCQFFPKEQFNNSTHLINHIQINPSGENFIFLHRYTSKGKQTDRLISYNFKTKQMKLITVSNLVSHFYWQTNNSLVAYLEDDNKGRCYVHIDLETLDRKFISCLEGYGDGHPGGFGSLMLTDTYPNRSGYQFLLLLKNFLSNESPQELAKLYHPLKFSGESRCDLHPRIDVKQKIIYFDSVYTGKRQLHRMDFNND